MKYITHIGFRNCGYGNRLASLLLPFLLVLFSCLYEIATAQPNIEFAHLTINEGLSQNTINCILKDKLGYLWFGTQDGLNRYDGSHFKIYKHKQKETSAIFSS